MKKRPLLVLLLVISLATGGWLFLKSGGGILIAFAMWGLNMSRGKSHLKALVHDEKEKEEWLKEAKALLAIDSIREKKRCIGAVASESPLFKRKFKRMGIVRIDVCEDEVNFMWMGGFDHTGLCIKRRRDSTFRMVAVYNDYQRQEIYPVVKPLQDDLKRR